MKQHAKKLFGLSLLAVVALMAMGSGAQAETGISVLVKGVSLGAGSKAFTGSVGATNNDVLTGAGIEVGCTGGSIVGTLKGDGTGSAQILYEGCTVLANSHCGIYPTETDDENGTNKGHITASSNGSIILHNGKYYLLYSGHPFTAYYFHDLGGCPLPLEEELNGSMALLLLNAEVEAETHTADTLTSTEETLLASAFENFGVFLGGETAMLKEGASATIHLNSKEKFSVMMTP